MFGGVSQGLQAGGGKADAQAVTGSFGCNL
jgi:hypothetical protein